MKKLTVWDMPPEKMARKLLDLVAREGIDQADVFISTERGDTLQIKKSQIDLSKTQPWETTASLRCHYKGGMSSIKSNLVSTTAEKFASHAASMAKLSQPDPDFVSIPQDTPSASPARGTYDGAVASLGTDELAEMAMTVIDTARMSDDHVIEGRVNRHVRSQYYLSCFGTEVHRSTTSVQASAVVRVERNGEMAMFFDWDGARRLKDLDIEKAARRAGEKAPTYLGAKSVKTADLPLVIDPHVGLGMLPGILAMGAIAESVQRNRSYFCGKLGEQVAVGDISLVDNGRIPWGFGTSTYDGEGFPHRKMWVVRKGVLEHLFHNSYTANKEGVETTGHAAIGYPLGISPTNLSVPPGDWKLEEMIQDVKEGIFVEEGGFWPNPTTGDASTTLDFAFKIENGELAYPVKNTLVGINVLDMLQQIDAISKETHEYPGSSAPGFRAPSAKISGRG